MYIYLHIQIHFTLPSLLPAFRRQNTQLGQLQMFKKKPLQCLKKRKEQCLLNVCIFHAHWCKSVLAVTLTLHCWLKKKWQRKEWDFQCSWVSSYHGTPVWHWCGPAAQSILCQCHDPATTNEGYCAVVATGCWGCKYAALSHPQPPGTMPGWGKFLLADWHWLRHRLTPEFMFLYTSSAYNNLPHEAPGGGVGCQCQAHHPQKETLCISPCISSPDSHPSPWPTIT